jgi:5-(carboxyamino)imidazole ribonucleotide synthase
MLLSKINNDKPLTLGILGAGQLAKMIANEAYKLGLNISTIDKSTGTPTGDMTKMDFTKGWEDKEELDRFIESADVVTLENEFISPEILEYIEQKREVFPSSKTISMIQDKFIQKSNFKKADLPLPIFEEINSKEDAINFGKNYGYPYLIKTRTMGYDGYGNMTIHSEEEIDSAFEKFASNENPRRLMAESFVDFDMELAVMVARSKTGEMKTYPVVQTIQKNHICHIVIAPAKIKSDIADIATAVASECVRTIDGVGVFGIELFLTKEGKILVNEIAPRPHNSGHYTIEACYTSQFETAIRAVLGLPLGSTDMIKPNAIMVNLLGERDGSGVPSDVTEFMKMDDVKLHLYNKKSSRFGRKMGHFTLIGDNPNQLRQKADNALNSFKW